MESTATENKNIQQEKKEVSAKYLRYAAAAFSLISFLTTAEGIGFIIGETSNWKGFLISFGIQAIVLVVGIKYFEMRSALKEAFAERWKSFVLSILILMVFVLAVGCSSGFSYVFLSNKAYYNSRPTEYNIEIDQFLSAETKSLRDYNDALGKKINKQMRNYLTSFKDIPDQIQDQASNTINDIATKAKITENTEKEIPEDDAFVDVDTFVKRHSSDYWYEDAHKKQLENQNNNFEKFRKSYEKIYGFYKKCYDEIFSSTIDIDQVDANKQSISIKIADIQEERNNLSKITDSLPQIKTQLDTVKSTIDGYFVRLSSSLKELEGLYDSIISSSQNLTAKSSFNLDEINRVIYSPEEVQDAEIDGAIENLKQLASNYLQIEDNSEEADKLLKEISSCIIYLEEFKNYQTLSRDIRTFEENNIRQSYIIVRDPDSEDERTTLNAPEIYESNWIKKRKDDIEQYIKLLKTLPNVDLLSTAIEESDNDSSSIFSPDEATDYSKYFNDSLNKAYEIERNKLAELNEIEQAILYFKKPCHPRMAIICLCIAVFWDASAFFIGMFLFYSARKPNGKEQDARNERREAKRKRRESRRSKKGN